MVFNAFGLINQYKSLLAFFEMIPRSLVLLSDPRISKHFDHCVKSGNLPSDDSASVVSLEPLFRVFMSLTLIGFHR